MLQKLFLHFCLLTTLPFIAKGDGWEISTLAGTGKPGFAGDGAAATKATINNPFGVIIGPDRHLYFCDTGNHIIRKIDRDTGIISTIAGTPEVKGYWGDGGPAVDAKLFEPYEVRFGPHGNIFFVEMQNNLVRMVDQSGIISTVAGTSKKGFNGDELVSAELATFNRPHSIQFGPNGELFVCDIQNHRIRSINLLDQTVKTTSGNGKSEGPEEGARVSDPKTSLKGPRALDFATNGDLWLALREGNQVVRFDAETGTIHKIAGTGKKGFSGNGGPAKLATLSGPKGISIGPNGNVYLADTESHSVRMIDMRTEPPTLRLIAGTGKRGDGPDGDPLKCSMARLHGIFVDHKTGNIYIGDSEAHKIRVIRRVKS